jgi:putative ABC transport system substrate-binding protein
MLALRPLSVAFGGHEQMRRREFATLLGAALVLRPCAGRAQQPSLPVIGLLDSSSAAVWPFVGAFLAGLADAGFVEGRNVRIEYRWADGHYDRLAGLAGELVRVPVAVLAATGITAALAAKAATTTIPIVFHTGGDPVKAGLVASLNRPGGNVTGVVSLNKVLVPKQLELLHELVPTTRVIAFLVNPNNGVVRSDPSNMQAAAQAKGVQLQIVEAKNGTEIDAAFVSLSQRRPGALIVQVDPFLDGQREQLAGLAARHALPAMAAYPEFATVGGLISYGNSLAGAYRLEGDYVGRILRGKRPAEMPVQQSVKTTLVINLKTAKALGVKVPPSLLLRADQIVE